METRRLANFERPAAADTQATAKPFARPAAKLVAAQFARACVAAAAMAIFAMPTWQAFFGLLLGVIVASWVVDLLDRRLSGAGAADEAHLRPSSVGKRRSVVWTAVGAVFLTVALRAVRLPFVLCLIPAVLYGVVWAIAEIRTDRARLRH